MIRIALTAIALVAFLATNALAVDLVQKATLEIKGQTYVFPVGDEKRSQDIFYLKKALRGDKEALEMFMGDEKERWFFIGDDFPLWLRVTADGNYQVVQP